MLSSSPLMAATLLYQYNHFNLKSSHKIFTWYWLLRKLSSLPKFIQPRNFFPVQILQMISTHSQLKINESLQICKLFAIETIVTISLNTYIYLYIYILFIVYVLLYNTIIVLVNIFHYCHWSLIQFGWALGSAKYWCNVAIS